MKRRAGPSTQFSIRSLSMTVANRGCSRSVEAAVAAGLCQGRRNSHGTPILAWLERQKRLIPGRGDTRNQNARPRWRTRIRTRIVVRQFNAIAWTASMPESVNSPRLLLLPSSIQGGATIDIRQSS